MSAKIIDTDVVQAWLKGFRKNGKPLAPRKAEYNGETVFVHSESKYYAIVSRTEKAEKMFSIPLNELK